MTTFEDTEMFIMMMKGMEAKRKHEEKIKELEEKCKELKEENQKLNSRLAFPSLKGKKTHDYYSLTFEKHEEKIKELEKENEELKEWKNELKLLRRKIERRPTPKPLYSDYVEGMEIKVETIEERRNEEKELEKILSARRPTPKKEFSKHLVFEKKEKE